MQSWANSENNNTKCVNPGPLAVKVVCAILTKGHITVIISQLDIGHVIQQSTEVSKSKYRPQ